LTVIPGLIDGHLHNAGGGPGVDLAGVRSMAELLAAVEARVKVSKPGDLVVSNSDWHEAQLREKRLPHRRDLDRVAPDNPVVLVRGGHEFIVNSAAMKRWNITRSTPVPPGGEIGHDADGELNVKPDEGEEWLRIGGMKTLVDGGFEGGHMRTPYEEPFGKGGKFKGIQVVPLADYVAAVRELNRLGWRVATHAVGDAAIDQVLDAYAAADRDRSIRGKRWSVEHFFIGRHDHYPSVKALELVISATDYLYRAGPRTINCCRRESDAQLTAVRRHICRT